MPRRSAAASSDEVDLVILEVMHQVVDGPADPARAADYLVRHHHSERVLRRARERVVAAQAHYPGPAGQRATEILDAALSHRGRRRRAAAPLDPAIRGRESVR